MSSEKSYVELDSTDFVASSHFSNNIERRGNKGCLEYGKRGQIIWNINEVAFKTISTL